MMKSGPCPPHFFTLLSVCFDDLIGVGLTRTELPDGVKLSASEGTYLVIEPEGGVSLLEAGEFVEVDANVIVLRYRPVGTLGGLTPDLTLRIPLALPGGGS
ncbi:MAG: hypothetical protein V3R87_10035 [Dehalococcoidia bacterium]